MRWVGREGEQDPGQVGTREATARPPAFLAGGNQAVARAAAQPGLMVRLWGLGEAWDTATGVAGELGQGLLGQELRASVGHGGANLPGDVMIVQRMLAQAGFTESDVNAAIVRFQQEVLKWPDPDGRVDPGGKTFTALKHSHAPAAAPSAPAAPAPSTPPPTTPAPPPTGGTVAADPASIDAELAQMETLQGKSLKKGSNFEEGGPERAQLVARIGEVRKAINGVADAAKKAEYFHRLNAIAPFYTQAANQNIIGRAVATTCNLTTVAMGLELLGKSAADYRGNWDTMRAVEAWAQRDLKNAGIDFESSRLADFMELVAVVECLGNVADPSDEAINAARMKALGTGGPGWVASGTTPLIALYARFGVGTEVITSPNSGTLSALGKKRFAGVWGTVDARQRAERAGKSDDDDVVTAGHNMAGLEADEAKIPLEGYKEWAMTTFTPILDAARPVSVGQFNHWMRLQALTDDYVIVDDPGGGSRTNRKTAWEEARAEGLFWQSVVAKA
jgi:hypothetical protein